LGDFNTTIVTGGHILVQRRITRAAARSYGYPNGIRSRVLRILRRSRIYLKYDSAGAAASFRARAKRGVGRFGGNRFDAAFQSPPLGVGGIIVRGALMTNHVKQCECCGAGAKISITDVVTRRSHHYCARHIPADLNRIIDDENRRRRGPKQQEALERVRALRIKVEQGDSEPFLKAFTLYVLDDIIRACERLEWSPT